MTFGKKLEILRKQEGLSQEGLSTKLNISRQAISKWELGTAMPDAKNIVLLSSFFGVSTDYLLKDELEDESPSHLITKEIIDNPEKNTCFQFINFKISLVMTSFGIIGILIMGILSSIYPAIIYDPPQGEIRSVISTGFFAFLKLHNIYWLFGICCILILFGIILYLLCKKRVCERAM